MAGYLDLLSSLPKCDGALPSCVISKTESDEISKQKGTLSRFIAYECKSSSSKFVEFWVPVQISNVQLEQYCSMLLSNAMALGSCSKTDTSGALQEILVSIRKCCDHPYIVDRFLQDVIMKDLEPAKVLDVGIKASGKLQFLDLILPEMRKRQLRVLILFQPLSGLGRDSTSIGDILDDFVCQRFGEDAYERIEGVGTIPSKKQAALNNFNNKDMGRFIFLLEYRACLPSIKLSSVDTIVIFDSDWNPANDLKAIQKITIDSRADQIMIFRLYTSWTLEEKILRLAEHHVDIKLQNLTRSTTDALLMWGATYLFTKLGELHSTSGLDISSDEGFWKELKEEFLSLISHECKIKDTAKLIIKRVQQRNGTYGTNLPLTITQLSDEEQPHVFWRKLLKGRNPRWKYLSRSTSRQRKRPQYFEKSPTKINAGNADVGSKRKKAADGIIKPVASKPVIEGEIGGAYTGDSRVPSHDGSQLFHGDGFMCAAICDETSFWRLLKLNISKLCRVLKLSVDVKIMVEIFLEYVIENYCVNKEPASTLQAFLISLCWIGSALLKHKLDRRQSLALAKKHLNFSCKEEETNSMYLMLEPAKEMFLYHAENQKKNDVSEDPLPAVQAASTQPLDPRMSQPGPLNSEGVKVEILERTDNQYVDVTESSVPIEEIPAKRYEGVPNDVVKQFDSVGMRVLAADSNIEIAEAGTIVPDGPHDREDQNDINPNDGEGHVRSVGMGVLAAECNQKTAEDGTVGPDASDALVQQNVSHRSGSSDSPAAAASKEKVHLVQLFVSTPSGQSVPTNLEIQNECVRDKEVQSNPSPLAEICIVQTMDAGNVDQSNSEDSSLDRHEEPCFPLSSNPAVAENQFVLPPASEPVLATTGEGQTLPYDSGVPNHPAEKSGNPSVHTHLQSRVNLEEHTLLSAETPVGEQQPDLHSADRLDCQPSYERRSQNPEGPPQVLGITAEIPDQGASRMPYQSRSSSDPLHAELEKLCELKDTVMKFHEDIKLKLKSDYEKEVAERIAQIILEYEAKLQDAEAAFQLKRKEVEISLNRVVMNKILAEAFRPKCQDHSLSDLAEIQEVTPSGLMQDLCQFPVQPSLSRSARITSSPAQSSPGQQTTRLQPPRQIVHQTAELFSTTPYRPSSNTNPSSIPSRPQPNIKTITPLSTPSRSLPSIDHATPSDRNLRINVEIHAPAPHIHPFTPSTTVSPDDLASHKVMPSRLASTSLPLSSPTFSQASARPPLPTNHNGPPQNSPRNLPGACPLLNDTKKPPIY